MALEATISVTTRNDASIPFSQVQAAADNNARHRGGLGAILVESLDVMRDGVPSTEHRFALVPRL